MFAAPGLLALIFLEYVRPQEYFPALYALPLLHIAAGLALAGFVIDLRLGLARLRGAPHLPLVLLFFAWCLVTLVVRAPDQLASRPWTLFTPIAVLYLLVGHCVQSFRMLQALCALLLAICIGLAALGVEQGLAPYGCHRLTTRRGEILYLYDGRPCEAVDRNACEGEGAEPGADYVCERVGLLGTQSAHGRVRYRGALQDPNELALALGIAMPFAFAFFDRRRSVARLALVVLTLGLVGWCVYFTRSRGGQLVFLTVLAVYFVRRFGFRYGLAVGLLLALPILVFGGRSGADDSTMERLECWWVGLHLLVASPGFGVGNGQFLEHHYLTAHNSVVLAAAELGLPGLLLWSSILYIGFKTSIQALRANLPPVARSWATAILASLSGIAVGSQFLSYTYKDVCWIYLGLSGVLYQAIARHDAGFRVRFGIRDLGAVALVDLALLLTLVAYTGSKLGW